MQNNMRVAYFINQYPKVSHTFIRREIKALESMGVTVMRYSLRSNPNEIIDQDDVSEFKLTHYLLETHILKFMLIFFARFMRQPWTVLSTLLIAFRIGWRSERGLLRHIAYVVEAASLAGWCRRDNVGHVHAHFGTNSATVAMFASQLSGLSFSFTAHGADELDGAFSAAMIEKLKRSSFVVAASWYVRSQLMRTVDYQLWKKIKVIHCGLDSSFLQSPAPNVPTTSQLVCVGRLCAEKAQLLLIEATAKLRDKGVNFNLVLAGDGALRPEIERAIEDNGIGKNVTITGWISNERVRQELCASRAMVLPSLIEGLPVAIMEAMALGRPVISTFIAGIPELVVPGKTGWLVPAGDVEALVEAIDGALAASASELEVMGHAGQLRVRERHNVYTEAKKLKQLFDEFSS